jgi:hypothetical protein
MQGKINYLIDIDGTVCEDVPNEASHRMPYAKAFPGARETINEWHRRGHKITFFTSRTEDMRGLTEDWLIGNGFKYHALIMNKPRGGNYLWIDNLVVRAKRLTDPGYWVEESRIADEECCDFCRQYKICEQIDWGMTPVYKCKECMAASPSG